MKNHSDSHSPLRGCNNVAAERIYGPSAKLPAHPALQPVCGAGTQELRLDDALKLPERLLGGVETDQAAPRIVEVEDDVDRQRDGECVDDAVKDMAASGFC